MSFVTYSGQRLIPAPFVSFQKRSQTSNDAEKIGEFYDITIKGTVLAFKGSPMSGGTFHTGTDYPSDEEIPSNQRLEVLFNKRAAVDKLFSVDGLELRWQSANLGQPVYCYPRIRNIDWSEGLWYSEIDYTITCDADMIYGLPSLTDNRFEHYIDSADESWSIEEGQIPGIYNVTHSVNAVGKRFYVSGVLALEPYETAKQYVLNKLGFSNTIFNSSILAQTGVSVADFVNLTPYNLNRTETVDKLGGGYSAQETWILSSGLANEEYTIRVTNNNEDPLKYTSISVEGTIRGHYTLMYDYDTAYQNALSYFNIVKSGMDSRVINVSSGNYISSNVSYDPLRGTINYSYEYDTRALNSGTYEEYTISQQFEFTDYRTVVGINGRVIGVLSPNETDQSLRYQKAKVKWNVLQSELYNRASTYVTGVKNLRSVPIRKDATHNPIGGYIDYSYEFNNRDPDVAIEEFTVSQRYAVDQGFQTVGINGSVQGYDISQTGHILERYNNALSAMPSEIEIYNKAQEYASGIYLYNNVLSKEIARSPNNGTISYQYEYSTQSPPLISGAISETISVSDDYQSDVFANIPIPGRIAGPILQDMNTKTARRRQISIEIVVPPYTGISILGGYNTKPNITTYIEEVKPTGTWVFLNDGANETWDWKMGRYFRQASWTYSD